MRGPPQEAVKPRCSLVTMTYAFPPCIRPVTFLRLSWVAATSQAGVLELTVQPLVLCPIGPPTYDGVIVTGERSSPLTSNGLVDLHVVPALWSVEQLIATELFPIPVKLSLRRVRSQ